MNDNSFWFCGLFAATLFSAYSETLYFKFLYFNPFMHNSEKWLKYVYPFFNIWQWLVLITDFYCQCESFNGQYLEFVEKKSWLFAINRFLIVALLFWTFTCFSGCSWWSLKKVKRFQVASLIVSGCPQSVTKKPKISGASLLDNLVVSSIMQQRSINSALSGLVLVI